MHVLQAAIAFIYFLSLATISLIGYLTYRKLGSGTTNSLFYTTIAGFAFVLSSFLIIASSSEAVMRFGIWLLAPSHWLFVLAITLFTLHFTGYYHRLTRRAIYGIYIFYGTLTAISATIPFHDLILDSYGFSTDPFPYIYGTPAPGLPFFLGIGYLGIFVAAIIFIIAMLNSSRISQRQFLTLSIVLTATPLIHFLEYVYYSPTLATGPWGFSITGIVVGFAYLTIYEDLLNLDPITRTDVVSSLTQPIIITDSNSSITDYNTAAQSLFPSLSGSTGKQIMDVRPELVETPQNGSTEAPTFVDELSTTTPDGDFKEYQVSTEQVSKDGRFYGATLVLNDITELKMYAQDLEQQTDQLEDFTSFVSHDLRNPIATSRQFVGMLNAQSEEERRYICDIDNALERMDTMIENLLTLTREGQAIEERDTVCLLDTVEYAWQISDTKDVVLEDDELSTAVLYADKDRLYTLFENLFRNVAEHATPHATVTVGASPSQNEFYIRDDGSGFPDSIDIFEKGATTSPQGTGLGLAIVERIVEAHGWEIRASEHEQTGGAKFTISGVKSLRKRPSNSSSESKQNVKS